MNSFFKITNRSAENSSYLISEIIYAVVFCLVLTTMSRVFMVGYFAARPFLDISLFQKLDFLVLSLRFDLKVITIGLALPLLTGLILFATRAFDYFRKYFRIYVYVIICILTVFSVINFFYFKTYDRCIDTFIFAMRKEDPSAVLKTVVSDYPVFTGSLTLVITCIVLCYLYKKYEPIFATLYKTSTSLLKNTLAFIILVLAFAGFIRGSFGTFPLRQLNANVCDKPAVNYCIPHGTIAFYWAYKWEALSKSLPTVTVEEIFKSYQDLGFNTKGLESDIFKPLEQKTAKNSFLKNNPPDIVFAVMESMGTHMLSYDDETKIDLLGALRKNFNEDFVFKNFVSEGDGTSDSMTRLLVSVPDLNLSTMPQNSKPYVCNIVKLFKEAGYTTIFVTASTASWRDYDNWLRTLGFDEVYERSTVKKDFPYATSSAWGIDDEYLFKEAYKILRRKHDKPIFMMTLSITNHPPYRMPKDADIQKIPLPKEIKERFPYDNTETIFATFRYANDQLGKFIDAIKSVDSMKNRTIIAATGDHNLRGIGYSDHLDELVFGHAVPFYLYLPEKYVKNTYVKYDKNRFGSHKDIISTIVHHALSDKKFHSFGCDLLSDKKCAFPFSYNSSVNYEYGKKYVCLLNNRQGTAFEFSGKGHLLVKENSSEHNCSREVALSTLQSQLYFLQAALPFELKDRR
ncbi:MAG: LTA synthase family protein [Succinivibrio sp.]